MPKIKIEDIIFWILILIIVAIALWLLAGSPPEVNALVAIALFVATSELIIWKKLFAVEKNTAVDFAKLDKNVSISFIKLRNDIKELKDLIKKKRK